ncbi:uncharacterized protein TRIADDRAFT_63893 [Trichoplax adhaerens]|uniref:J domain-containing protein n=1 Tax=Trichoplax adhaerens TaxID=10228 RepID=B3RW10_TRIAD|nr:hypothetical protein TRIADDRAFT_63893 [Trichoplax adhaerens]EDV25590.1 hypothetical protein TRIADDRAFT_63893 [Trichoplax adhaerens]|eukprot:XP_002111623.1 hypothetical protein TRIADDRAFT_63893 [Trichoplax adhaerens]
MEKIWESTISPEDDFYKMLNCDESSSLEQINTEFRIQAKELHPDRCSVKDDEDTVKRFALLQKARNILMDPDKRKAYDLFRRNHGGMSYDQWSQNHLEQTIHWTNEKKTPMLADSDAFKNSGEMLCDSIPSFGFCINVSRTLVCTRLILQL